MKEYNYSVIWIKLMDWCSKYWGCHQIPERSFFINGYQFPVCARCTGIIVGYILSLVCCFTKEIVSWKVALLSITPMAVDGGLQYTTKYQSKNQRRFWTGFLAGFGFIQMVRLVLIRSRNMF